MMPSAVAEAGGFPSVSVIIPCRNEARYIRQVVDSALQNEYPGRLEQVLVVDGMSDDGTRAIVAEVSQENPSVRLVDNPRRIIPAALNIGLAAATGDVVVRMDGHTTYPAGYIERCVTGLLETGADNVGGACHVVPGEPSLKGRAFAQALSHVFGVGNAHYKLGITEPMVVDAVPFGCMWKRRWTGLGPYDERFARSEDIEFSARLRAGGGVMMLLPDVHSYYHSRDSLGPFLSHSWSNGMWITYPLAFALPPNSWRHYIPLAFVSSLLFPLTVALWWPGAAAVAGVSAVAYGVADLTASTHVAIRNKSLALGATMLPVFAALHLTYGIGSLWGIVRAVAHRVYRRAAS